ncbi:MAG TPA: hypothetical protein ENI41_02175, partial [Deltaproteobacteria bacterium]|nr:hypothetical protein [Deltaproteobacteria bacterium]
MNSKNDRIVTPYEKSVCKLYVSAALGAFCLGLGDLLNNEHAATVLKIGEMIKQHLYPKMDHGGLI